MHVAFYIAKEGDLVDKIIDPYTGGYGYSHVELVMTFNPRGRSFCFSASPREGNVRFKKIDLTDGKWVVKKVDSTLTLDRILGLAGRYNGRGYDWVGVVLGLGLGKWVGKLMPARWFKQLVQNPSKWYCSEITAYLLGREFRQVSPNELAKQLGVKPAKEEAPYRGGEVS